MLKWLLGDGKKEEEERARREEERRRAELERQQEELRLNALAIMQEQEREDAKLREVQRQAREKYEREEAEHQLRLRRKQDELRMESSVQIETISLVVEATKTAETDMMKFRMSLSEIEAAESRRMQEQAILDARRLLGEDVPERAKATELPPKIESTPLPSAEREDGTFIDEDGEVVISDLGKYRESKRNAQRSALKETARAVLIHKEAVKKHYVRTKLEALESALEKGATDEACKAMCELYSSAEYSGKDHREKANSGMSGMENLAPGPRAMRMMSVEYDLKYALILEEIARTTKDAGFGGFNALNKPW